jgi:hypothetical protein
MFKDAYKIENGTSNLMTLLNISEKTTIEKWETKGHFKKEFFSEVKGFAY